MSLMKKLSLNLNSFIFLVISSHAYSSEKNVAIGKASIIDGDTIIIKVKKYVLQVSILLKEIKLDTNFQKKT